MKYSLFLSPHPDDLVFSTFSALVRKNKKLATIYFNVSKFTCWPLKSKPIISAYRTLEDRVILGLLGAKTTYLFLKDTSLDPEMSYLQSFLEESCLAFGAPDEIFCPLGVGGNLNHQFVRSRGIELHRRFDKIPKLFFYEDLPYSARVMSGDSVERRVRELSPFFDSVEPAFQPLTKEEMKWKLLLSRAYLSQNDHRHFLALRAASLGRECSNEFAEKYYLAT